MILLHPILRKIMLALAIILVGSYFAYNFYHGDHGFLAYKEKAKILDEDRNTLSQLQMQENTWQRRVDSLKEKTLDPDMLDARARIMLNLSGPDDIVVLRNHHGPLF